jgi:hypothetical protein
MAAVVPQNTIGASKILFESDLFTFTFMPTIAYELLDTPGHRKIIITYSLIYKNKKTQEGKKSEINYFLSDGHTNMFRANILFPNNVLHQEMHCYHHHFHH